MAFSLFKKKEEPAAPTDIPLDQVFTMQQQGLSNNQIMQALQHQGYPPQQIYDALAQSEAQAAVGSAELPQEVPQFQQESMQADASQDQQASAGTEELVESIIEEKWRESQSQMNKLLEWKDQTTVRIDKMEQSILDTKADIDNLHKAIVAKIGDYDKNLLDVGTEIKAMEKVFQKVLPELTGSVTELGRITKGMKAVKK